VSLNHYNIIDEVGDILEGFVTTEEHIPDDPELKKKNLQYVR
jgi:hypothetical protein